jgi:3,4-dihydroxy 2-butanone 4-phosphate synthase/GTP cyclohydrolase II
MIDTSHDNILRNYGIGAQILGDIGVKNMILLSKSPKSVIGLEGYDLRITSHRKIN